jgi:Lon protease-like protein
MIGRCLEEESEFGIVWLSDDGLRPIGCACEIAEVLERHARRALNLVARGTRAVPDRGRQDELPYPAGTVEFLDDRDEEPDPEAADAAHAPTPSSSSRRRTATPDRRSSAR